MRIFYSTCPAGLESACEKLAAREIASFGFRARMSGALIYSARVDKPACHGFQNTYLQIARLDKCRNMTHAAREFLQNRRALNDAERAMSAYGFDSFRVMFSDANQLVSIEKEYREGFERAIRIPTNREKPATELVVLKRSEGVAMLLLRLTRPEIAQKGELSPAFAACLAALAKPEEGNSFIDPFCGGGAIALARLKICRAQRVFATDINPEAVKRAQKKLGNQAKCEILDALKLSERFSEGEFNEIVADPPWGIYKPLNMNEREFCRAMLAQFTYILSKYGVCVVLTASKEAFAAEARDSDLEVIERLDVLVNGKKAAVFALRHER